MAAAKTLQCGVLTLRPSGMIALDPAGEDWSVELSGTGAVGKIVTKTKVVSARRGGVTVRRWHGEGGALADALRLLAEHLFASCELHRLDLDALDTQADVLTAALASGFVEEGRRRHTAIVDSHWRDRVQTGLLAADWQAGPPADAGEFVPAPPQAVAADLPTIPPATPADFPLLQGQRISCRRKRPEDKELFYRWVCCGDWWAGWMPHDADGFAAPTREQFEGMWTDRPAANSWVVEDENGVPIGQCFYTGLDLANRSAEADILLYEKPTWGKGYGTEGFGVVVRHLLEDLHLHRVRSGTWSGNVASVRMQVKSGLRIETRSRESYLVGGQWHDGIGTGILADEYPPEAIETNGPGRQAP